MKLKRGSDADTRMAIRRFAVDYDWSAHEHPYSAVNGILFEEKSRGALDELSNIESDYLSICLFRSAEEEVERRLTKACAGGW